MQVIDWWVRIGVFAPPSVVTGVARLFDLWGWLGVTPRRQTGEQADASALRSDWAITGDALRRAMRRCSDARPPRPTVASSPSRSSPAGP